MHRDEAELIQTLYFEKFGVHLAMPPLDFGVWTMDDAVFYGHAKDAIERGRPVDWGEILTPIPDGAIA